MKKRTKSTLTMGPEPYFATCSRCDKHEPMPELPMPVDAFVKFAAYVEALHVDCLRADTMMRDASARPRGGARQAAPGG